MNQKILQLQSTTFGGRRFARKQIEEIQNTVNRFSSLSLRELGHTICEHYGWLTPAGTHKIHTCLNALEKMEKLGLIKLPTKMIRKKRMQKEIVWTDKTDNQPIISCSLEHLMPIKIEKVIEKEEIARWNEFVDRYHYLGYKRPIGSNIRYYIIDCHGRKLGCLLFSFAVCSLACRDNYIGWKTKERKEQLKLVINNNRFLIFPWVQVKCLASKALSLTIKQIANDWEDVHGYRPVLLETFVDHTKYNGTCYQAANWQCIGKTTGEKNKSQKEVYVFPLTNNFREILTNKIKTPTAKKNQSKTKKRKTFTSDDPFINFWQKIIYIVTKVATDFDQKWQKRRRIIDTLLIILFIFRLVFSKNKQGYNITIAELWHQCRTMDMFLPQQKPVAASAFCNARTKLDENIFKTLNTEIIREYKTSRTDSLWNNHRIFAVDGSKLNLPRQLLDDGYITHVDKAYYPQGLLSCLYELKTKIPIDFDLVSSFNERKAALTHLKSLQQNDVVVYDRGYFSYPMLYFHLKHKIHAVFRIPNKTYNVVDKFIASQKTDQIVFIMPTSTWTKRHIKTNYPEIEIAPLQLRLVKYTFSKTTYVIGTTLIDKQSYTINQLSDAYHSRWGIEELYKISKTLIEVEDFHSQTERGVKQELFAHFVLITFSRIFADKIEDGFMEKQNTFVQRKINVNMKNCLLTLARNLEGLFIQQAKIIKKTVNSIISSISTCRQKQRPTRSYKRISRKPKLGWSPSVKNVKEKTNIKAIIA